MQSYFLPHTLQHFPDDIEYSPFLIKAITACSCMLSKHRQAVTKYSAHVRTGGRHEGLTREVISTYSDEDSPSGPRRNRLLYKRCPLSNRAKPTCHRLPECCARRVYVSQLDRQLLYEFSLFFRVLSDDDLKN